MMITEIVKVKGGNMEKKQSWKLLEKLNYFKSLLSPNVKPEDRPRGSRQRKFRYGRKKAKRVSRDKRVAKSRVKRRMTKLMMRNRRLKGRNARSGK